MKHKQKKTQRGGSSRGEMIEGKPRALEGKQKEERESTSEAAHCTVAVTQSHVSTIEHG